jgi:hypothetical protein
MSGFLQLDDLLSGLSTEGEKVSSGVFTVDLRTAMDKLSKFQMASPYQYCLRWLQAAVAGRARTFNWNSSPTLVSAEMDEFVLDPERISQLPTLLLEPGAGRAEQHLSAGLNAALRTRAKCIRLRSGNYQGIWKPGNFQIEYKEMGLRGTKIVMERHVALWRDLFLPRAPAGRDHEQHLLHHQAACAPLSLGIQGCAPERLIPELEACYRDFSAGELCFVATGERVGFKVPPFNRSRRYPDRCAVYAMKRPLPSQLFPVKDGVLLKSRRLEQHYGQIVLADVSHLTTDLTGLQLVEDEAYKMLIEQVSKDLLSG